MRLFGPWETHEFINAEYTESRDLMPMVQIRRCSRIVLESLFGSNWQLQMDFIKTHFKLPDAVGMVTHNNAWQTT